MPGITLEMIDIRARLRPDRIMRHEDKWRYVEFQTDTEEYLSRFSFIIVRVIFSIW